MIFLVNIALPWTVIQAGTHPAGTCADDIETTSLDPHYAVINIIYVHYYPVVVLKA